MNGRANLVRKKNKYKRYSFPTRVSINDRLLTRTGVQVHANAIEKLVHFPFDTLSNTEIGSQSQYLQGNVRIYIGYV